MCLDVRFTYDFTPEQLRYIERLIAADVSQLTAIVRSPAFENYGPTESHDIHQQIRIGASLLGSLPKGPRS